MKKLLTLLTALILLFGMAACTVTENNSSEPPASSVVTPSNLPFVPETNMGGFGRSVWAKAPVVWENEKIYYMRNQKAIFSTTSIEKIYGIDTGYIGSLVLYDGYLYFIEESTEDYNYIVKIKTDGSDKTVLYKTGAELSELFIYEGYLYYKFSGGTGYVRYRIKLDGSEPEEKTNDFSPLGNGWIYKPGKINPDFTRGPGQFICGDEVFKEEDVWHGEYGNGYISFKENIFYYDAELNQFVFYSIRNTENKTFVSLPVAPSSSRNNIFISNWIFYTNENEELCKIDIEGNGYEVIAKNVQQFEVCGEWILYYTTDNDVGLVKYDGTENKIIQ
ncbi:MAG: DUF5050 domain-containing protein [Clostridia bacterium]|nr:DUF5050 domain-containing protein [Clostridia bacterium]